MRRHAFKSRGLWRWGGALALALVVIWARALLWNAALQLFFGMLVALMALPVMRRLEKRLSPGLSASLSMTALSACLLGAVLLLVPFLIDQAREMAAMLPGLYARVEELLARAEEWLAQNGVAVDTQLRSTVMEKGQGLLSGALPGLMGRAGEMGGKLGKIMLAPMFAFYFLRDRRQIGARLLLCVPESWRQTAVTALREMRRETAGFVRGQLMVSAVVGGLTAVGLLFCGVPAWLMLGVAMGVLELITYIGPILGGVLVLFFSLPGGLTRTLWAMAVVLVVQQLEGGMLSPQLMSGATRLHPVWVLLCLMLGGTMGGMAGILLAIPLLLCLRAGARVVALRLRYDKSQD